MGLLLQRFALAPRRPTGLRQREAAGTLPCASSNQPRTRLNYLVSTGSSRLCLRRLRTLVVGLGASGDDLDLGPKPRRRRGRPRRADSDDEDEVPLSLAALSAGTSLRPADSAAVAPQLKRRAPAARLRPAAPQQPGDAADQAVLAQPAHHASYPDPSTGTFFQMRPTAARQPATPPPAAGSAALRPAAPPTPSPQPPTAAGHGASQPRRVPTSQTVEAAALPVPQATGPSDHAPDSSSSGHGPGAAAPCAAPPPSAPGPPPSPPSPSPVPEPTSPPLLPPPLPSPSPPASPARPPPTLPPTPPAHPPPSSAAPSGAPPTASRDIGIPTPSHTPTALHPRAPSPASPAPAPAPPAPPASQPGWRQQPAPQRRPQQPAQPAQPPERHPSPAELDALIRSSSRYGGPRPAPGPLPPAALALGRSGTPQRSSAGGGAAAGGWVQAEAGGLGRPAEGGGGPLPGTQGARPAQGVAAGGGEGPREAPVNPDTAFNSAVELRAWLRDRGIPDRRSSSAPSRGQLGTPATSIFTPRGGDTGPAYAFVRGARAASPRPAALSVASPAAEEDGAPLRFASGSEQQQWEADPDYRNAKAYALALLGRSAGVAAAVLARKVAERGHGPRAVAALVEWLKGVGALDDTRYARMYCCSKWNLNLTAPAKMAQDLKALGVGPEDVAVGLEAVFGPARGIRLKGEASQEEAEVREALLNGVRRYLGQKAAGKAGAPGSPADAVAAAMAQRRRLGNWLAYRGYSMDFVYSIFKLLKI